MSGYRYLTKTGEQKIAIRTQLTEAERDTVAKAMARVNDPRVMSAILRDQLVQWAEAVLGGRVST